MATIVALSTPLGHSGLAIIRLSGPQCRVILKEHLKIEVPISHQMKHGRFYNLSKEGGGSLDQLNYVFMEGPKTSTGEDVLEIFPHGNPVLIQKIIQVILSYSEIRGAQPGEFTRRSLENGKLDLIQAEAVGNLIHAQTTSALANAHRMLRGDMSKPLLRLKEDLKNISILIELDVDFVEEELEPDYKLWQKKIDHIHEQIKTLETSWVRGKKINLQPKVALFGKPNAGKSSLINAALKQERLIVSSKPGTTRDYVEVQVNLEGGIVAFVDTAGIGESIDDIDSQAMEKSRALMGNVQYKILVEDGETPIEQREEKGDYNLRINTKADMPSFKKAPGALALSNITGKGINEFLDTVNKMVFKDQGHDEEVIITTERQHECLVNALECLERAKDLLKSKPEVELLAFEIRSAHHKLSELIGDYNTEEILEKLFKGFCIGK